MPLQVRPVSDKQDKQDLLIEAKRCAMKSVAQTRNQLESAKNKWAFNDETTVIGWTPHDARDIKNINEGEIESQTTRWWAASENRRSAISATRTHFFP